MNSAVVAERYTAAKKGEYISYIERLGPDVCFFADKWVCARLRRAPSEKTSIYTLYFRRISMPHREIVKYFAAISLIHGKRIATVKNYVDDLIRFFDFWCARSNDIPLCECNEFTATEFYQYLERRGLAESTNIGVWSSVNMFFKTMNGWNGMILKNPFTITPYCRQRRFDEKYIPEGVARQLDEIFKREEIDLHLRCAYWLLRLIPSRIGEIAGIRIGCLKRFNGQYVLFIPTWKQNGGWHEPAMRSIHLEQVGIAAYLIDIIMRQQETARQLQEYMPDGQKDCLLTYRQRYVYKNKAPYHTRLCFVATGSAIRTKLQELCARYAVVDDEGKLYKVTTHQFRHNGITDRLAAGFTTAQIAEMTGHHGDAMIYNAYTHLDLMPETIVKKQEFVSAETGSRENRYILFGGRILNMEAQLEARLLKNLRAHRVRGGICSDITGCKSDMWNCLECPSFVPDADQLDYYKEQAFLWREKCERFSSFPIIRGNAEKNIMLYEQIIEKLRKDGKPS